MAEKESEFLTPEEVARELRVTARTVRRLITEWGQLPAVRVGGQYRIRRDDLEAYLRRSKT